MTTDKCCLVKKCLPKTDYMGKKQNQKNVFLKIFCLHYLQISIFKWNTIHLIKCIPSLPGTSAYLGSILYSTKRIY